jgi:hypothetical protein
MRKVDASLIIAIAVVLAAPSQVALAGGKRVDNASPQLFESTTKGTHIPDVVITNGTTSDDKELITPTSSSITHRKAGKG